MAQKITIGSDPEFIIVNKCGCLVPAYEFFANCKDCNPCIECGKDKETISMCEGCYDDCDNCSICNTEPGNCATCEDCRESLMWKEIGTDGCDDVGELRPTYAFDPIEHHRNIAGLIHSIQLPEGYKLLAGTIQETAPLGGHIHIGLEEINDCVNEEELARYMSFYCGIPLKRIERKTDLERRGLNEERYGYFGGYEINDWGMEFRMPASWLVTSKIAKAALCLAYVVANEYIENPKDIDVSNKEYREWLAKDNINNIIEDIKDMELYSTYKKQIKPLFKMIEEHRVWYTGDNLKERW